MRKTLLALLLLAPAALRAYDNVSLGTSIPLKKLVDEPAAALATRAGRFILSDRGGDRLAVFSAEGKWESYWGGKGKDPGRLNGPRGLAEDAEGRVYVADAGNHRVQVFSPDGKFLSAWGSKGAGPGQFADPSGVAVSRDGFVFVSDTGNGRVQVFNRDGIYLHSFGAPGEAPGQLKDPADIAVSPAGQVYVLDAGNGRVQKFSAAGKFLGAVARPAGKEASRPAALAVDDYGYLYVADGAQNKVEEYDAGGAFAGTFGTWGAGAGQFKKLSALAATPDGGVLVLDGSLERAQLFRLESAAKVQKPDPLPALRLFVKAELSLPLDVDDIVFAGDTLVGVSQKNSQVLVAPDFGRGPARTLGAKGKGAQQLNAPLGAAAAGGTYYIVDSGNRRLLLWDAEGKPAGAGQIGGSGKREGQFKSPRAAAVDAQGRIYVIDEALARCQVFSRDGIFLSALGSEGEGAGQFKRPVDLAMLPKGLAVLDADRRAVLFFDDKGKFQTEVAGQFAAPAALAADAAGRSFVYVLDAGAGQVRIYNDGGQFVAAFGSPALFQSPKSLALDPRGRLWVADGAAVKPFRVTLLPRAPDKFKAKPGEGQVELSWAPDAERLAASYAVYRSTDENVPGAAYQVLPATATYLLDSEIVPGLTYHYSLAPRSASAEGEKPLEGPRASAKVLTTRPANLPPLDIASIALENVFSAQYKYYVDHPVGKVSIKNNTEKAFQKVRVGFILQDFMDYATETVIDRLDPGARRDLDLKAVFNNKILSVSEDTPIQAQLTVTYYEDQAEKVFRRSEPFILYGRNAMSWEDPRRLATFVTPKDPPLLEFARSAALAFEPELAASPLNPAVVRAAAVFDALGVYGLTYLKDPNNPFEKAVQNTKAVDYIQYPRETLKRKSGDCDDLTNLYASALESVTVPTVLLDVPGHVLMMFQAEDSTDPLGFPPDQVVQYQDASWIPVEVTQVGKSFDEAWQAGARAYQEAAAQKQARIIDLHDAWRTYAPATLPEEAAIPAPAKEQVAGKVSGDLEKLAGRRLAYLAGQHKAALEEKPKDEDSHLQLGILYARHGKLDESAAWLDKLLELNPRHAAALNNRGNVAYLKGDAPAARQLYEKASAADPSDGGISLNLARAAWKAGDKPAAEKAYKKALELQPELKKSAGPLEEIVHE